MVHPGHPMAQVEPPPPRLDVIQDRPGQPTVGRSLEQVEFGGLGAGGEHQEDGQHAAGRNRGAIDETQGIGNRVPHPFDTAAAAAMTQEPGFKTDGIELADHPHGPVVIHQSPHDRAGAQGEGIAQLVNPVELGRSEKGLEAIEGSP